MKEYHVARWTALAIFAVSSLNSWAGGDYAPTSAHFEVNTLKFEWMDASRIREVPVKIYYPASGAGPFPVIIFSHGLGGSRDGYEYLGRYWAGHGYVSVHVTHAGSDTAAFRGVPLTELKQTMAQSLMNLQNAADRPRDVSIVIDQLTKLNGEGPTLKSRLDLNRIGVAGHSFGAFTTLAIAGQSFAAGFGRGGSFADPRVEAAIPMSATAPLARNRLDAAYANIKIPCFHMTGTKDDSPFGDTTASERRVPYDHINGADQYLVTFNGADHMTFSGRLPLQSGGERDAFFHVLICESSTAFWDAYLKGDAAAKAWLAGNGFESRLKDDGTFEKKLVSRVSK